jgi:hypothetical protein
MTGNKINITDYTTDYINGYRRVGMMHRLGNTMLIASRYYHQTGSERTIVILVVAAILIASFPIGTTINTKAVAISNNNNTNSSSSKSNAICFDGDAADETYYVGYVDAINDFHHIKRYGITWFDSPQAEADYHRGYRDGWADAKVNGTTIDPECWDTRVGN